MRLLLCLFLFKFCLFQNINSLKAVKVRITTVYNYPWIFPANALNISDQIDAEITNHDGFLVDVLNQIAGDGNLNYTITLTKDGRYGLPDANGRWSGMIGELQRGEADMALADITATKARLQVVDFSKPFMTTGVALLAKRPPYYLNADAQNGTKGNHQGPLVIYPVSSIEDLPNQDVVRYGAVRSGATIEFFKNSNNPLYQRIYQHFKDHPEDVLNSYQEGRVKVSLDNGRYVFFMEDASIKYSMGSSCDYVQLGSPINSHFYAFAFPRGSRLREKIDVALLALQENGVLESLVNKWFPSKLGCTENQPNKAYIKSALGLLLDSN